MNSNQIALGIIKAVAVLAIVYYVVLPLIGIAAGFVMIYIAAYWSQLTPFHIKATILLLLIYGYLLSPFAKKHATSLGYFIGRTVLPFFEKNKIAFIWVKTFIALVYVIAILIIVIDDFNKHNIPGYSFISIIAFLFLIGAPALLYWAVRKSFLLNHQIKIPETMPLDTDSHSDLPLENSWKQVEGNSYLYCYQCTKKLGLKNWLNNGNAYCDICYKKFSDNN